jgi:HD-GYP domain-containing protein (c-di-GMP phosphodiesterase class II)
MTDFLASHTNLNNAARTQQLLDQLEALSNVDVTRTYHFSLRAVVTAQSIGDSSFEVHASLHAVSAALQLGDFQEARHLLSKVFDLLERISGIQGKPFDISSERAVNLADDRDLERLLTPLGLALEASDLETSGHIQRVVNLTQGFGQHLGLSKDQLFSLRVGAYLHDVGKMAIPPAVLHKPAKLDALEWLIVQRHAIIGALIAELLPNIPADARKIVRHHHEHWDGSGYPGRLREHDIPLLVRVFSLIDVFDALRHARAYKIAWSVEDSLNEIHKQSGKLFDPTLAQRFLSYQRIASQ